jgi:deoxycytidine triphosphate deaminase
VLGSTLERVALPDDLVARLEGKSPLGRLGLLIHPTAGYVDPGWDGKYQGQRGPTASRFFEESSGTDERTSR